MSSRINVVSEESGLVLSVRDDFIDDFYKSPIIPIGGHALGTIGFSGDMDWYAVELIEGYRYQFNGVILGESTSFTPLLEIQDSQGVHVAGFLDEQGVVFRPPKTGTYFLSVTDNPNNSTLFEYSLFADFEHFNFSVALPNRSLFGDYYDDVMAGVNAAITIWSQVIIQTGESSADLVINVLAKDLDGALATAFFSLVDSGFIDEDGNVLLVTAIQQELTTAKVEGSIHSDADIYLD